MKKLITLKSIFILALMFFVLRDISYANWILPENHHKNNTQVEISNDKSELSKSDSLPAGVTKEWMKSLTDENGNRIIFEKKVKSEEPEGDAMQQKTFNGAAADDQFGYSVSSAGDVNGDGYDDVIIGAPFNDAVTFEAGRAYIYYGGILMNTIADVILSGSAVSNNFGSSVSEAGDVNGDGFSDVIVGANGYNSNTGRAYIYFGGTVMNNTADVIMNGEIAGDKFGATVSESGDVNGDGYSDVLVSAYNYSSIKGRAYIYYGGSAMNNVADVVMTGVSAGDYFGSAISGSGDVNGDGYSDVIISSFGYSSYTGIAYIFYGGAVMDNVYDLIFTGENAGDYYGVSLSGAGDVNSDGYSDVIVGAFNYSSITGKAYVYFGGAVMDNIADVSMTGEALNNYFGYSVSNAGDVNGDGYDDVIIGAFGNNSLSGKTYIYYGGVFMNDIADVTMTGDALGGYLGVSVAGGGDVNGDGYSDVIAGAYAYNSNTGRAYVYTNTLTGEDIPDFVATGEAAANYFGVSVSGAGDVNGDGYPDVIVGADFYNSLTGRAYIYFGGSAMNNIADVTLTGESTIINFGSSVSEAGDVNGDGYSDVIVGAYNYSSGKGRAYVYLGGSSMNTVVDVIMTGEASGNIFGNSVSGAGDVNGDGYSDVIVGAQGYSSSTGRSYIYFGGSTMNNIADVVSTGETGGNFGRSVSDAGDVNGDGYSDVIIGSSAYLEGRAYILFGGVVMNNFASVTLKGTAAGEAFGSAVSSAGDVNGDGYSDVIVSGNSSVGKVYIFYGGFSMNIIPDVILTNDDGTNNFGSSVSKAGDVNGDGYSDVIISAYAYNSNTGRAYIYFGGAAMNNFSDIVMTGETSNNYFGRSVSDAGDLNGDGFADIIVGADSYSGSKGRAYFYLSSAPSIRPVMNYVKDVPADQGGKVNLKWARSSMETTGINAVTNYLVYRSLPPGITGYQWQQVADVNAVNFPFYYLNANTIYDSSSSSTGSTFFFVKAKNTFTGESWNSNILSGRSIDNIAPPMVSPFTAASVSNNIRLNWKRSASSDLLNYILYRSTFPTIDPETEPQITATADSTYLDTSPLMGVSYYFIVAQDIHNNKSIVAVAESPNTTLNLTMFIEGFYNAGSNSQFSDTITVQLRNSTSPFAIIDEAKAIVSANGSAVLKFGLAVTGQYYIAAKHRNSIETWSKAGGETFTAFGTMNYNLSSTSSQAFGNNITSIDVSPVRFAIFSGDENQDGIIDATDISDIENDAANSVFGYVPTDITGDDAVDASDISLAENNAVNSIGVVTP